jgi:hypothetical protein
MAEPRSRFGALVQAWYRLYGFEGRRRPRQLAVPGTPALVFQRSVDRTRRAEIFRLGVAGAPFDLLEFARRVMIAPGLVEAGARAARVSVAEAEAAFHVAGGVARSFDHGDLWAPVGRVYLTFLDNFDTGVLPAAVARRTWPRFLNLVLSDSEPYAVARRWTAARGGRRRRAIELRGAGIPVGTLLERLADRAALVRKLAGALRLRASVVRDQLAGLAALLPAGEARPPGAALPPDAAEIARCWKTDAGAFAQRLRPALDDYRLLPSVSAPGFPTEDRAVSASDQAAAEYLVDTTVISLIVTLDDLARLAAALAGSPAHLSRLMAVMAQHFFRDPRLLDALGHSPLHGGLPDQPFPWKARVAKLAR